MKKLLLLFLLATNFGCKKDTPEQPANIIGGKTYVAKWKVSNNLQQYIYLGFGSSKSVKLHYSSEKTLNYGNEDFTYVKSGDAYVIKGTFNESQYFPAGTSKTWTITPIKENSEYTFNIEGLKFVEE